MELHLVEKELSYKVEISNHSETIGIFSIDSFISNAAGFKAVEIDFYECEMLLEMFMICHLPTCNLFWFTLQNVKLINFLKSF
jgi:hypothetical protein